ncbi:hypothetical protein DFJ77DRAFT_510961 [Powellomyces hirtus]|nr:hypothetical protein DFJ77DRAFT_510961 [Powellomyces hirtus]
MGDGLLSSPYLRSSRSAPKYGASLKGTTRGSPAAGASALERAHAFLRGDSSSLAGGQPSPATSKHASLRKALKLPPDSSDADSQQDEDAGTDSADELQEYLSKLAKKKVSDKGSARNTPTRVASPPPRASPRPSKSAYLKRPVTAPAAQAAHRIPSVKVSGPSKLTENIAPSTPSLLRMKSFSRLKSRAELQSESGGEEDLKTDDSSIGSDFESFLKSPEKRSGMPAREQTTSTSAPTRLAFAERSGTPSPRIELPKPKSQTSLLSHQASAKASPRIQSPLTSGITGDYFGGVNRLKDLAVSAGQNDGAHLLPSSRAATPAVPEEVDRESSGQQSEPDEQSQSTLPTEVPGVHKAPASGLSNREQSNSVESMTPKVHSRKPSLSRTPRHSVSGGHSKFLTVADLGETNVNTKTHRPASPSRTTARVHPEDTNALPSSGRRPVSPQASPLFTPSDSHPAPNGHPASFQYPQHYQMPQQLQQPGPPAVPPNHSNQGPNNQYLFPPGYPFYSFPVQYSYPPPPPPYPAWGPSPYQAKHTCSRCESSSETRSETRSETSEQKRERRHRRKKEHREKATGEHKRKSQRRSKHRSHDVPFDALPVPPSIPLDPNLAFLHSLMSNHLAYIKSFVGAHFAAADAVEGHKRRYVTLQDTKQYLEEHKRKIMTMEEAIKKVEEEDGPI